MFPGSLTQPLRNIVWRALFRVPRGIARASPVPRQPLPCRSLSLQPRRAQSKPVSSLGLRLREPQHRVLARLWPTPCQDGHNFAVFK